jgi:hypothetical protein
MSGSTSCPNIPNKEVMVKGKERRFIKHRTHHGKRQKKYFSPSVVSV